MTYCRPYHLPGWLIVGRTTYLDEILNRWLSTISELSSELIGPCSKNAFVPWNYNSWPNSTLKTRVCQLTAGLNVLLSADWTERSFNQLGATCGQQSISRFCWYSTPELQLQISSYPNFPRCWVIIHTIHWPKIPPPSRDRTSAVSRSTSSKQHASSRVTTVQ
jgi:hypothetical protein